MRRLLSGITTSGTFAGLFLLYASGAAAADSVAIPTGQTISPTAAPGSVFQALNPHVASAPGYTVGQAETTAVSPDGKTLLVLTSGFNLNADAKGNRDPATSTEFVFVFDISKGTPRQQQAIPVPNAFSGIAWSPDGSAFYVAGGQDDNVHTYKRNAEVWSEAGTPIAFHHTEFGVPQPAGNGLFSLPQFGTAVGPLAAGVGVTADGHKLVVVNLENDSISVVDLANNNAVAELDLRPGRNDPAKSGVPGGEFPFWAAVKGNETAYISSERDREIVVVNLSGAKPTISTRIPVEGNPNKMVLNKAQTRLYVTADNSDLLYVINTGTNAIAGRVKTAAPARMGEVEETTGSSPNSVSLSPDERTAYVTNAGTNNVAVIDLTQEQPRVVGLIPTGWYPTSAGTSADGKILYVINAKSNAGPNSQETVGTANQYVWQLTKAGFLTLPVPRGEDLEEMTEIVARNNGFQLSLRRHDRFEEHDGRAEHDEVTERDAATMRFLRKHIQHVIYVVKENRTYDQILGDLPVGNGDPALTMYGQAITPNFHALSRQFVDLDNFYCSGEVSMDGWQWSTAGRGLDLNEKVVTVNYGKGGGSYDSEGLSRDIDVALPTGAERAAVNPVYALQAAHDPDLLPGTANAVAADGPSGEEGAGYIWNAALRAGRSVRNYGFFEDLVRYSAPPQLGGIAPLRDPAGSNTQVAFPTDPALLTRTDPFFRGFDNQLPDFYRYTEWAREFDAQVKTNSFPAFELVRLMHDHTGNFATSIDGVNTPELQQADNDYAVALLIEKIAHSPYGANTLVFVLEDDAQDGPDHIDAHRSTAYVAGPYVRHGKVVSTRYATINMLRTIEDILDLGQLSLHDGGVRPMTDVFSINEGPDWTFKAIPSQLLLATQLPIPAQLARRDSPPIPRPLHDAGWWAGKTQGFTFAKEDLNDASAYNRVLWEGTMGDLPYPTTRSGLDLRHNRKKLLRPAASTPVTAQNTTPVTPSRP
jgi:DNA-binding beta-propeller fold protein YncE